MMSMLPRAIAPALVTIVTAQSIGCSVLFVDKPPATDIGRGVASSPSAKPPDCDVESLVPIGDGLIYSALYFTAVFALVGYSEEVFSSGSDELTRGEALKIGVVAITGLAFGISGVYGLHQIARCRRMHGLGMDED